MSVAMLELGFFLAVRARHQIRRNHQTQGLGAYARAVGDDEIAQAQERLVFLPHGDVEKGVRANHEKNAVAVAVVDVPEIAHGIDGIVQLRAAEVLTGFGQRRDKVRVLGAGQRDHGKAVWEGRQVLLKLVRRPAGRNKMHFIEIEATVGGPGDTQMTAMNGIKRTAKKRDTARMMFCGGAVRLRSGQCASQEPSGWNFLMNRGLPRYGARKDQLGQPPFGPRHGAKDPEARGESCRGRRRSSGPGL